MRLLVGQSLLHCRRLAGLLGVVAVGLLHFRQFNPHRADFAGELERNLVGLGDGRALIGANIGAFVCRVDATLGSIDAARGDGFSVEEERAYTALADTAAIIGELEAYRS